MTDPNDRIPNMGDMVRIASRLEAIDKAQRLVAHSQTEHQSDEMLDKRLAEESPSANTTEQTTVEFASRISEISRQAAAMSARTGNVASPPLAIYDEYLIPPNTRRLDDEFVALDGREFVVYVYRKILGRYPDAEGMTHYLAELANGTSKQEVVERLRNSIEATRDKVSVDGELRNSITSNCIENALSLESLISLNGQHFIEQAYSELFSRRPDSEGLAHYLQEMELGISKTEIVGRLRYSTEGKKVHRKVIGLGVPYALLQISKLPIVGVLAEFICAALKYYVREIISMRGDAFLQAAYCAVLGRPIDREGMQLYSHLLLSGESKIRILCLLQNSREARSRKKSVPGLRAIAWCDRLARLPLFGGGLAILSTPWTLQANILALRRIERQMRRESEEARAHRTVMAEAITHSENITVSAFRTTKEAIEERIVRHGTELELSAGVALERARNEHEEMKALLLMETQQTNEAMRRHSLDLGNALQREFESGRTATIEEIQNNRSQGILESIRTQAAIQKHASDLLAVIEQRFSFSQFATTKHFQDLKDLVPLESYRTQEMVQHLFQKGLAGLEIGFDRNRFKIQEELHSLKVLLPNEFLQAQIGMRQQQTTLLATMEQSLANSREVTQQEIRDLKTLLQAELALAQLRQKDQFGSLIEDLDRNLLQSRAQSQRDMQELKAFVPNELVRTQDGLKEQVIGLLKAVDQNLLQSRAQSQRDMQELKAFVPNELVRTQDGLKEQVVGLLKALDQNLLQSRAQSQQSMQELKAFVPSEMARTQHELKEQVIGLLKALDQNLLQSRAQSQQSMQELKAFVPSEMVRTQHELKEQVAGLLMALDQNLLQSRAQSQQSMQELKAFVPSEMARTQHELKEQVIGLSTGLNQSLMQSNALTHKEIEDLKLLIPVVIERSSSTVAAQLSKFQTSLTQKLDDSSTFAENELRELKAMVPGEFSRAELGASDRVASLLSFFDQRTQETRALSQQDIHELRESLPIELARTESTIREHVSVLLTSLVQNVRESNASSHLKLQELKALVPTELAQTQAAVQQEMRSIATSLESGRQLSQAHLQQLFTTQVAPFDQQMSRIELYSMAAARRVAVGVDTETTMVRTELGYVMCPATDTALMSILIETGELEPGIRMLIQRLLRPGDIFIDVGANIGMHTIAAGRALQGKGRVIAFEPFPATARCLERSVWMNGLSEIVEIHQAALSSHAGNEKLYLGPTSGHHSLFRLQRKAESSAASVLVPVTTLDQATAHHPFASVIKIDVEGAELAVLEGAATLLGRNPDVALIVEFGPAHITRAGRTSFEWMHQFKSLGFEYRVINHGTGALENWPFERLDQVESANLFLARPRQQIWDLAGVTA